MIILVVKYKYTAWIYKMKKIAFYLVALFFTLHASAMQWGLTLIGRSGTSDQQVTGVTTTNPAVLGYGGGLLLLFPISNSFTFRTGVLTQDRVGTITTGTPIIGTLEQHFPYTDIPLHLMWNFSSFMSIYAGVNAAFWNQPYCKGTGVWSATNCGSVGNIPPAIYPTQAGITLRFGQHFNSNFYYEAPTQANNAGTAIKGAGMGATLDFLF